MCKATCRRSIRPISPPRSSRSPTPPSISRPWPPRSASAGERTNPNVVKVVGTPVGPARLRALYFTRATAPSGDGPLYHHIGLYAFRRAALERFVKLPPSPLEQREKLEQLRALEAGMRIDVAIVDTVPLGVDTPGGFGNRARHANQPHHEQAQQNLIPGRAGRQFAHRLQRGLSRLRAAAVPDLRGCLRRGAHRPRCACHDPDRQFGGRPRRRHPSPDAGVRPAYRRRMVPAGAASIDGAARRDAQNHQDGREPRPCAWPVPQHHPHARHQGGGRRRHRGRGARSGRGRRHHARGAGDDAGGENLRPANPQEECRRRQAQHHALRRAGAQAEMAEPRGKSAW